MDLRIFKRKASAGKNYQMKKAVYISLTLALFVFACAERSFACSCSVSLEPEKKLVQEAFTSSDAIFSGKVVEVKDFPADESKVVVKIKVGQTWKGESKLEIVINAWRKLLAPYPNS